MRSLAQRWNVFAPTDLAIDDTLGKALLSAILLTDTDVHTVRVQVSCDAWQTGFVGDAELALTHTAAPDVGAVFAALLRFATTAGIGAQTTYGFGEVHPEPLGGPPEPHRAKPRSTSRDPGGGPTPGHRLMPTRTDSPRRSFFAAVLANPSAQLSTPPTREPTTSPPLPRS